MRNVEYYCLFDDHTWDTYFVDVPENIFGGTPSEDENNVIDYIYKNTKMIDGTVLVGLYSWTLAH